jgi:hypothetical protein
MLLTTDQKIENAPDDSDEDFAPESTKEAIDEVGPNGLPRSVQEMLDKSVMSMSKWRLYLSYCQVLINRFGCAQIHWSKASTSRSRIGA